MRKTAIEGTNILVFMPASGGAGASTMAAACALASAKHGFRTFYLNLELYGQAQLYFNGPGSGGLEDVLYAIEARKRNVAMRIQSVVKHSPDGVCFLDSCQSALDIAELLPEQVEQLVREIASSDSYDVMVLDMDFSHSKFVPAAMALASQIVFVSNGTPTSNQKFERIYKMLIDFERTGDARESGKTVLAYNNFRSKTGMKLADDVIRVVGTLPHVSNYQSVPELIEVLSVKSVFEELLDNFEE
jgi:MinD-like ATPase involved in chromosome partitioning or flagellar assembly